MFYQRMLSIVQVVWHLLRGGCLDVRGISPYVHVGIQRGAFYVEYDFLMFCVSISVVCFKVRCIGKIDESGLPTRSRPFKHQINLPVLMGLQHPPAARSLYDGLPMFICNGALLRSVSVLICLLTAYQILAGIVSTCYPSYMHTYSELARYSIVHTRVHPGLIPDVRTYICTLHVPIVLGQKCPSFKFTNLYGNQKTQSR